MIREKGESDHIHKTLRCAFFFPLCLINLCSFAKKETKTKKLILVGNKDHLRLQSFFNSQAEQYLVNRWYSGRKKEAEVNSLSTIPSSSSHPPTYLPNANHIMAQDYGRSLAGFFPFKLCKPGMVVHACNPSSSGG
jgi:hypothetical protein